MKRINNFLSVLIVVAVLTSLCGCHKNNPKFEYPKENAGGTGYGASSKSELYIEDFYFLTLGTEKAKVEMLAGNAHYFKDNNKLSPVYTLNNGDSISITYDEKNSAITNATYTFYENQQTEGFFSILVELGILKSDNQLSGSEITVVPGVETGGSDGASNDTPVTPSTPSQPNTQTPSQTVKQGVHFAKGMYNFTIVEPALTVNMPRDSILTVVGKPNYYFSHSFSPNSYIIDCYNLSDGSKLYLDYGYERLRLRCAAIYKNGTFTSILGTPWSVQTMPEGYTRTTVSRNKLNRLSKNSTPAKVYSTLGEPSWYEGTRGSYNDVYLLTDGAQAVLGFGSAHNKLTTITIKETDGKVTVIDLK